MLKKIFDSLLGPIFIVNKDLKIVYCNEAVSLVVGIPVRKIMRGMHFVEIFSYVENLSELDNITNIKEPTLSKEIFFKKNDGESAVLAFIG